MPTQLVSFLNFAKRLYFENLWCLMSHLNYGSDIECLLLVFVLNDNFYSMVYASRRGRLCPGRLGTVDYAPGLSSFWTFRCQR